MPLDPELAAFIESQQGASRKARRNAVIPYA
jgi:hypothetical protein